VRWGNMRGSDNVEDRESAGPARGIGGGFKLGGVGLIAVLAISWFLGLNPLDVLVSLQGGDSASAPTQSAPPPSTSAPGVRDETKDFIARVLGDTEDVWRKIFNDMGRAYREPRLVLFTDRVQSGCGFASAAVGPFYCPEDEKVYIDLGFFEELRDRFAAPGEFAQAYVIAHEIGHHVQKLLGTERQVRRLQSGNPSQRNPLSVRLELQADCYAGIWGHSTAERQILEAGDVDEALSAAASIGDDRIQRMSGRGVQPESFTHGSSAQRVEWFKRGFESGDLDTCDTFARGTD